MLRSLITLALLLAAGCGQLVADDCVEHVTDRGLVFQACDSERWRLDERGGQLWGYSDLMLEGFDADRLIVSSSHNHQGPDTMGLWGNPYNIADPISGISPAYQDAIYYF